ncbi:MAG TPA: hypothetical protein VNM14_23990 [Planctomycetota bacterium]|jgi:hypothetical protein|nr:hypothetical protein [Planctomycetota bacterium]
MGRRINPLIIPLGTFLLAILLSLAAGARTSRLLARVAAGPTCDDPVTLPICVRKILEANGGSGGSTMNFTPQALSDLEKAMNEIWAACCISFTLTAGSDVTLPADAFKDGKLPVANSDGQTVKLNEGTKKLFKQMNSTKCLNLYYVHDAIAAPKSAGDLKGAALIGDNGMVVDDNVSGALDAHEAGHNLGLKDETGEGNLMNGVDSGGQVQNGLREDQCKTAHKLAKKYLRDFAKAK